ncbi:MAG: ABC transporter ATP-binding protein [Oscillospiraceae bacterium]|nr:ABC transporter ATP-binding protein [Oscillospiraceae bacterium]
MDNKENILISCKNVSMNYDRRLAVDDVSFDVYKGDYLCIVGENGSGKSTLMKGILGLMKLNSGEIFFTGMSRNELGYLPQQTVVQRDFPASVYEVVLSGCLNQKGFKPFFSRSDKEKAKKNIELLKITNIAKKSYRDLSGGQQQRVLLARALCATRELLILDEPVTGLDPVVTADMYNIIKHLNGHGITVIMVSHDIPSALKYGTKILHMGTKLEFFGTVEEYMATDIYTKMTGGHIS